MCGPLQPPVELHNRAGTSSLPITYDWSCPGGTPATVTLTGTTPYGFLIQDSHYLVIRNVSITGPTSNTGLYGAQLVTRSVTHIQMYSTVTQSNTESSPTPGATRGHGLFIAGGSSYITSVGAISRNNYGHGIRVQNSSIPNTHHITIDKCVAHGNRRGGVSLDGTATDPYLIQHVVISRCRTFANGDGIYSHMAANVIIRENISYYNSRLAFPMLGESYGIGSEMSPYITIQGNVVYENESDGIEVWGNSQNRTVGCRILNNTVFGHRHYTANNASGNNGIEERTGYGGACIISGNTSFDNIRNYKLANDSTETSVFSNNISRGGEVGLYIDKSNEPGNDAFGGWQIVGNIFEAESQYWIYAVPSVNTSAFSLNAFRGPGKAWYNGQEYRESTIYKLDSTAKTNQTVEY